MFLENLRSTELTPAQWYDRVFDADQLPVNGGSFAQTAVKYAPWILAAGVLLYFVTKDN